MAKIKKQRQIDIMDQFWNPHKEIYNPVKKWPRKKRCRNNGPEVAVGPIDTLIVKTKPEQVSDDGSQRSESRPSTVEATEVKSVKYGQYIPFNSRVVDLGKKEGDCESE